MSQSEDAPPIPPARLATRARDAHKGLFGRVVVIAGSRRYAGAAALAALGAARGGAGLVHVAVPDGCADRVACVAPEIIVEPQRSTAAGLFSWTAGAALAELMAQASSVVLGPGLDRSDDLTALVRRLTAQAGAPIVLDADGLEPFGHGALDDLAGTSVRVITPHPGEAGRLLGRSAGEIQEDREGAVRELARRSGTCCVLKGAETLVAFAGDVYMNTTGNPGLATGGSGDVLAGIIGAFLGQGLEPWSAARFACHVHGRAADLAREETGQISMLPTDVLLALPDALREVEE